MHFQEYLAQWIVVLSLASLSLYLLLILSISVSLSLYSFHSQSASLFAPSFEQKQKKYNNEETLQVAVEIAELFLVFVFFLLMYVYRSLQFNTKIPLFPARLSLSLNLFLSLFPLPRSAEVLRGFGFVFGLSFCIVGSVVSASSAVPLFTPLPSCISRSASNLFAFSK